MNWSERVDLERALHNVTRDSYGDWYRDPWKWVEVSWAVACRPEMVIARLNGQGARAALPLSVPKEDFGVRPAVILDPIDRVAIQAVTDQLLPDLFVDAHPWVFGWRPARTDPRRGTYNLNDGEWNRYRSYLRQCSTQYDFALKADIASFFPSVDLARLDTKIRTRSRKVAPIARLESFLADVNHRPGRTGLPQRCLSSSSLANMYLSEVDESLEANTVLDPDATKPTAVRWMDDYWLFGSSAAELRRIQVNLSAKLYEEGLSLNTGKTRLLEGPAIASAIDSFSHSGEGRDPETHRTILPEVEVLRLVDSVVSNPASASRSNLRFIMRSVTDLSLKEAAVRLIDVAAQMPHAADHTARMSRRLRLWDDAYLDFLGAYLDGEWPHFSWSIGQFVTGLPSTTAAGRRKGVRSLSHRLANEVDRTDDLVLITSVLSRLAAWQPDLAIQIAEGVVKRSEAALCYRSAGLFMLAAGADRSKIARILSSHEENFALLLMLTETSWERIPVVRDFSGLYGA